MDTRPLLVCTEDKREDNATLISGIVTDDYIPKDESDLNGDKPTKISKKKNWSSWAGRHNLSHVSDIIINLCKNIK